MLKKALVISVLIVVALATNGTIPVSAIAVLTQDLRPLPSVPSTVDSSAVGGDPSEEVREEFHQTYPLSATGRVGLENINGGVQIKVWDRAAVQLDATKKAYRKERLAEAKIEVNSTEDNLHIKTEYPDWNQNFRSGNERYDNPATVEYVLTIPRTAILDSIELVNGSIDIDGVEGSVKASSINGPVTARGLRGDVKLSTINGPLQAVITQLDEAHPISLGSVNGSVNLVIPSDSNASVRAGTVHGGITNDFGLRVKHGEYVGHSLDGQIGNGGARIKLGNVNGGITLNHAQDGRALSPATSLVRDQEKDKEKDKDKDKDKDDYKVMGEEISRQVEQATATAMEGSQVAKMNSKMNRDLQREAQRQVDTAIRDAQREMERAQLEIQRETARQVREIRVARVRGIGSGSGSGAGSGSGNGAGWNGRGVSAQETKTFTVNGAPRVNVSTFDGSVVVNGWDKSEVMYTATKRGDDDEGLRQVNIQTEQDGAGVSIIATSNDQRSGSAQLEVWVPRKATLHVSSDDGSLKLNGVSGDITLRTGDGSIEVNDGGGALQLNTGDGHIHVIKFDGQLDARTGDGSIQLDGNFNALSARTGDGGISLTVPNSSNFTVETNAANEVTNEGLTLSEDIAPSRRVKRWRVGSGGKVFVLHTGDGNIVLRSR
jgi:DUF4097 and DUF4098 domain-containing protein YvlB